MADLALVPLRPVAASTGAPWARRRHAGVYASATERATAKKRRQRARRRAEFVAADPSKLDVVNRGLVAHDRCPLGCTCASCLFPPEPYRPRVARFAGALT